MAGSRTEKHTAVYRNVKRCEFHNIGDYIVVTSIIGGTTFCAFFDSGLHTEESIKRRGSRLADVVIFRWIDPEGVIHQLLPCVNEAGVSDTAFMEIIGTVAERGVQESESKGKKQ